MSNDPWLAGLALGRAFSLATRPLLLSGTSTTALTSLLISRSRMMGFRPGSRRIDEGKGNRTITGNQVVDLPPLAIHLIRQVVTVRLRGYKTGYLGALEPGQGRSYPSSSWLWINLALSFNDFAIKSAVQIRISFRSMIMVIPF